MGDQKNMNFENVQNHLPIQFNPTFAKLGERDWRESLGAAVLKTDEEAIWEIMAEQLNNDEAHSTLASMVSRMAYQHAGKNMYCELFMMPVIAPPGCKIVNSADVWKAVRSTANEALVQWFRKDVALTIFDGIMPMDWITTWRPKIIRDHLNRLLPGNERLKAEFLTENIDLPDDAPRLGFVAIACSSRNGWPDIPDANTLRDKRLMDVILRALQISAPTEGHAMAPIPKVLAPERLQFAITDGISSWLMQLHDTVGIESWALMPSHTTPDVVKVTMC